jgi:hypothetical protein
MYLRNSVRTHILAFVKKKSLEQRPDIPTKRAHESAQYSVPVSSRLVSPATACLRGHSISTAIPTSSRRRRLAGSRERATQLALPIRRILQPGSAPFGEEAA